MFDTDVLVLGGGPAGLAAAIAATRRGFHVTLADAGTPPIDKACGEGLMPDSLNAAASLGIEIPASAGFRFAGIRFVGESHSVASLFPEGFGLGVRRKVLHSLLIEAADRAGVKMHWGSAVTGLEGHVIRLRNRAMSARWVVGADGNQSTVRRWSGLSAVRQESRRFGFRRHYAVKPWSDHMEIHWSEGCQFYVTPVAEGEICLVLMSRNPKLRIDQALQLFPSLMEKLQGGETCTPERGSFAAARQLRRVTREHIALIGDASGTVDAITGEGLCLAFQQSAALASALEQGDLRAYEAAHRKLSLRPTIMGHVMLTMDRSCWIRRRALRALSARPELFTAFLAAHLGKQSAARFAAAAVTLGWEVATG